MKYSINIFELDKHFNNNELYICREDLIPFCFGGNKARKAQYFFKEIIEQQCTHVVTYGSTSSNHCRVVANLCKKHNMHCTIISPEENKEETNNSLLIEKLGAKFIFAPIDKISATIDSVMENFTKSGIKAYFIPGGGHGNIGTQAYVDFYKELAAYKKNNTIKFDYIFFASGTGTTQAGIEIGAKLFDDKVKIIGISVARKEDYGKKIIWDSINEYIMANKLTIELDYEDIIFIDDYTQGGYGQKTKHIDETIDYAFANYGLPLDRVYTGKAFYGMCDYVRVNNIKNKKILFIHTGGTPLFFDKKNKE